MKIIITHQNADFDGLGAMLGVRKLWPDHHMVLGSAVSTPVKKYLALHRDWLSVMNVSELNERSVSEVVVVDTRDQSRVREFSPYLAMASSVTVFDHHPPGEEEIEATMRCIEPVGACTTLLCERLQSQGIELNSEEATLMMLGLYADTGSLSFPSTTVRDLEAAAYLLRNGASLPVVNRYMQQRYSPEQQQLLVALLGEIEVVQKRGLRLGLAMYKPQRYVKGAALVVERLVQLLGLDACFAILQAGGKDVVQLIGRSRTRHVDVAEMARRWGGGGHPSAASARIQPALAEEIVEEVKSTLDGAEMDPLSVADFMSAPVQTVTHDMTLEEAHRLLERWDITGVPVLRDGKLAGVVSRSDTDAAIRRGDWSIPVSGFMTHKVLTASPGEALNEALERMTAHNVGRLPVMDGERIVGIISRTDVRRRLYGKGNGLASE